MYNTNYLIQQSGGNFRDDQLFDKLDTTPKEDVDKLIKLQKETTNNSISKQIRDSANAIEENILKLEAINDPGNSSGIENSDNNNTISSITDQYDAIQKKDVKTFEFFVNSLNNSNNFISYIEELYKIIYKSFKVQQGSDIEKKIKSIILGRIIYNIHYFRRFTKHYNKERFKTTIKTITDKFSANDIESRTANILANKFKELFKLFVDNYDQDITKEQIKEKIENKKIDEQFKKYNGNKSIEHYTDQIPEARSAVGGAGPNSLQTQLTNCINGVDVLNGNNNMIFFIVKIINCVFFENIKTSSNENSYKIFKEESDTKSFNTEFEDSTKNIIIKTLEILRHKGKTGGDKNDIYYFFIVYTRLYDIENNGTTNTEKHDKYIIVSSAIDNFKQTDDINSDIFYSICVMQKYFADDPLFFALEVYYGIIYNTSLRYDLCLTPNNYILERLQSLNSVYTAIENILYDDTYRTLRKLYLKKYPSNLNIFRIDSIDINIFNSKNKYNNDKSSIKTENDLNVDLVLLSINDNGKVDIEKFKKNLHIIYDKNEVKPIYEYLNELNKLIINIEHFNSIVVPPAPAPPAGAGAPAPPAPVPPTPPELSQNITEFKKIIKSLLDQIKDKTYEQLKDDVKENAKLKELIQKKMAANGITTTNNIILNPDNIQTSIDSTEKVNDTNLQNLRTSFNQIKDSVKNALEESSNKQVESSGRAAQSNTGTEDQKGEKGENSTPDRIGQAANIYKELSKILELEETPDSFETIIEKYRSNKTLKGGNIDSPVNKINQDYYCDLTRQTNQLKINKGFYVPSEIKKGGDNSKLEAKKKELEANLENVHYEDELNETIAENTQRNINNFMKKIDNFKDLKVNIDDNKNEILDSEYVNKLQEFNINDIEKQSYTDLRKNLNRIKNNEYFEDIKITNEDIYTFIATTYFLRIIALYVSMWLIHIEIIKDVESVIICYIITYILLFILVYSFVNLHDNKFDTTKSFLYYFYSRVNLSYTRFIIHLGILFLLIIIPFIIRTVDKESVSYKGVSDAEKRQLYTFITNMSTIVWIVLSIIAFFFK